MLNMIIRVLTRLTATMDIAGAVSNTYNHLNKAMLIGGVDFDTTRQHQLLVDMENI
jgi:hypothetical protein